MKNCIKIAIIAGEPSGDMLAANLIASLKKTTPIPIEFMGIGGEKMLSQGFNSSYNMDILSIGGYGLDVISAIPKIYCLYRKIVQDIIEFKPDVFIGVDAPDFNFHVEKKLKLHGIKTIHYISPTIWAWKYERIYKIKKTTDLMLCIFPMEEAIYTKESINAKFVGNPLAQQIELDIDIKHYRDKLGILDNKNVFTVLVGSRKAEIKNLGTIFIEACKLIATKIPESIFLFPFSKESTYKAFLDKIESTAQINFTYQVLLNKTSDAIKSASLVLAKSGTVTLEVALCKKPMVISYKLSKITEWLIRRKITIKYVGQPNIFLNEEVAKELLQDEATVDNIATEMISLYYDKDRQEYMIKRFYELHNMLMCDTDDIAATTILNLINIEAEIKCDDMYIDVL